MTFKDKLTFENICFGHFNSRRLELTHIFERGLVFKCQIQASSAESMGAFNTGFETANQHRLTLGDTTSTCTSGRFHLYINYRRHMNLEAKIEIGSSYVSCKRLVPGGFNVGLIG
jgi:hypothetical protein